MPNLPAAMRSFHRTYPEAIVAFVVIGMAAAFVLGGLLEPLVAGCLFVVVVAGHGWIALRKQGAVLNGAGPALQDVTSDVPVTVFDALPDPVILLDGEREVRAANLAAKELFDSRMVGVDLALSLRHPTVLSCVDAVLSGEPVKRAQIALPVPVARNFEVFAIGLSARVPRAKAVRVVLVLHDLTVAARAEQMRADFVANVSHELRTPLSALVGFIETLKGPARDDPAARDHFLDIMQRESERMARLIGDLLSLSRVEVNEHVQPRDAVDLAKVLRTVAEVLAVPATARRIAIEVALPDPLPAVSGDEDQLAQVFQNLVDNAIKYSREGSRVTVEAEVVERIPESGVRGVKVAVRDEGEGIPAEHIPRLTERFYRIDKARSRSIGGTGLGLAIVKHIVSRHRGRLKVESQEGHGSTFTVFLRLSQRPASASGAGPATS